MKHTSVELALWLVVVSGVWGSLLAALVANAASADTINAVSALAMVVAR